MFFFVDKMYYPAQQICCNSIIIDKDGVDWGCCEGESAHVNHHDIKYKNNKFFPLELNVTVVHSVSYVAEIHDKVG